MADIERISREDCVEFFRTYYAPGNASIYAVGDLDPEATLRAVERAYGDIPAGPGPEPVAQGEPPQRGERRAVVRYPSQAPAVLVGWRGPDARNPDAVALDVLQTALGAGESSRLRRRLVETEELAVSVHVSWGWRKDQGVFCVFAELAPGVKPERAERVLWEEIAAVAEKGIGAAELRRAQRLLRSSLLHELATHSGVAHAMGLAESLLGDWRAAGRALELYRAVQPKDVRRVAREWLAPHCRCVVTLQPGGEG
jgi:predicted Zn-dependent peptidase